MFLRAGCYVLQEVDRRLAVGAPSARWHGHVHRAGTALTSDSSYRPQDLRAAAGSQSSYHAFANGHAAGFQVSPPPLDAAVTMHNGDDAIASGADRSMRSQATTGSHTAAASGADRFMYGQPPCGSPPWALRLMIGSAIAEEARRAVQLEAGYRCSAGIACNKILAKLCSGIHKPADQTVLPPPEAAVRTGRAMVHGAWFTITFVVAFVVEFVVICHGCNAGGLHRCRELLTVLHAVSVFPFCLL